MEHTGQGWGPAQSSTMTGGTLGGGGVIMAKVTLPRRVLGVVMACASRMEQRSHSTYSVGQCTSGRS